MSDESADFLSPAALDRLTPAALETEFGALLEEDHDGGWSPRSVPLL